MYIVIELQTDKDGKVANIVNAYESQAQADSKYHSILATAAISNVPIHAATMINEEGYPIMNQCYKHSEVGE